VTVFVDTWAWIALAVRRDQHHLRAKKQHADFVRTGRRYVTTDWVFGELITQLYRVASAEQAATFIESVQSGIESGQYQLERISPQRFAGAWGLRTSYSDKPAISFVDFTSMVVMRDLGIQDIFTGDAEFQQVGLGFRLFPER
jgi:predicted nucleic acid-binding protein